MMNTCGSVDDAHMTSQLPIMMEHDDVIDDGRDGECYASSGEESFDMPSASQVGTNDYQQQTASMMQQHRQHEYLPTLEEVSMGRRDTDPLLGGGGGRAGSDVTRHLHPHQQRHHQHASGTSSSMTSSSYHHHTGDSGMSAGVGSAEQSSVGAPASNHYAPAPSGTSSSSGSRGAARNVPAPAAAPSAPISNLIDDKFVGTMSPPPSAVSMQSGYNSTASSCWQYQPYQQQQRMAPPAVKPKSWRPNGPVQQQLPPPSEEHGQEFPGKLFFVQGSLWLEAKVKSLAARFS